MNKRYIVAGMILLIILTGICITVSIFNSPEYTLAKITSDVNKYGIDGLNPYLTDEAQSTLDKVSSFSENKVLNSILSFFSQDDYVSMLKSEIATINWEVEDVLKNHNKADVYLNFNYENKLVGTIQLTMIRENDQWKISKIGWPDFKKIDFGFKDFTTS